MSDKPKGLTRQALAGFAWMAWGKGAQTVLDIVVLAALARLLTPAHFGVVSAALIVIRFSGVFSRLGVGPALVQLPVLETRHLRTAFAVSLWLGVVIGGIIFAGAPLAAAFFDFPEVTPVLRALALVFPLQGLSVVAESVLQRELRFRALANLDVVCFGVAYAPVGIGLALAGAGMWALVGAHVAQSLLRTVILLVLRRPRIGLWPERRAFGELLYFGGGFTAAKIANYLAKEGDYLVVGRYFDSAALGIYTRAYKLMSAPAALFGGVLDDVLFPTMARVQEDIPRLTIAYRRGVALIALVMLPATMLFTILAPELVTVTLGPQWTGVIAPFEIIALGLYFRTSYKMSDSLARAKGAVYRRAWRQAVYALLVVAGAWIGHFWGLTGVAVGVMGALATNFFLMAELSIWQLRAAAGGLTWRSFGALHLPALKLAAVCGIVVWSIAAVLRSAALPAAVVAVGAGGVTVLVAVALLRYRPNAFLGSDGRWMVETLRDLLLKRLSSAGTRRKTRGSPPAQELPADSNATTVPR